MELHKVFIMFKITGITITWGGGGVNIFWLLEMKTKFFYSSEMKKIIY